MKQKSTTHHLVRCRVSSTAIVRQLPDSQRYVRRMNDIEVSHIYISQAMMVKIANEVFQKDIDGPFVKHCPIVNDAKLSKFS
ncbi:hypothetical protein EKA85_27970 [Pseudomonas veronii]|nr:hypothetical protein EKA85_27970 [Pseudomonas veronii]